MERIFDPTLDSVAICIWGELSLCIFCFIGSIQRLRHIDVPRVFAPRSTLPRELFRSIGGISVRQDMLYSLRSGFSIRVTVDTRPLSWPDGKSKWVFVQAGETRRYRTERPILSTM